MPVQDPPAGLPRDLPRRPWVVLLVDDEADVLRSMTKLMEGFLRDVKVVQASSGRQALAILEGGGIDLIISDFRMPGMDGIDFLHQARLDHPTVPRVMLTAFDDELLARRAQAEAAVKAFISKASSPDAFLARIQKLFEYQPTIQPEP